MKEVYTKKKLRDHIYDTPDTYVGGEHLIEETIPVLNGTKISYIQGEYIPAIYKIFDEIIVNSRDAWIRGIMKGSDYPVTKMKVWINKNTGEISVYNDGKGIDIVDHETEVDSDGNKIMTPQLIFGELLTSSNYEEKGKVVGGKNGYGAKLTNIFSTRFRVETVDVVRSLQYIQEFENNMKVVKKPKIKKFTGKPYTKITWITDFDRFGIQGFSETMLSLFERRVYDLSGMTDKTVSVYYNDEKLKIKSFENYMKLYLEDKQKCVYDSIHERWDVGLTLSNSDKFKQVSFVNGVFTMKGGKHVDLITKQVISKISDILQKKHKKKVPDNYIKNYIYIFINATIEDPSFDSQTKERLITTASKFGSAPKVSDKLIKSFVSSTDIIEKIVSFAEFKENKGQKKTDGSKKSKINVPKLDDANWAGTKKSHECILILTEGDSAKSMAVSGLSEVGRDKYGVFPLRGKLLNVKDASIKQITNNTEITNLKKIIGLASGKDYKDTKSLRYGKVMIMTDQDHDGSHIKGLVLNLFNTMWPSLIKMNFVTSMITPIVKVSKGKQVKSFYNLTDYNAWVKKTPSYKKWKCKYYKGLGTSTSKEAKEYFKDMMNNDYIWTEESNTSMDLAFKKTQADERKKWLYKYDENNILKSDEKKVHIEEFIHKELIHFSNSDLHRSVGTFDGFKPSQRKILYSCLKRNLTSEIRVAQLAGYVSENAAYHHGEASLQGAIIGMAQNFVGANNINLLVPGGQFGTRIMGGSDSASPRYIHTQLHKIVEWIYPKGDLPILERVEDDGILVEPKFYAPVIPIVLVNGMTGIGTGFSTNIPQHNPLDLIESIQAKLNGKDFLNIQPWFRGFKGTIFKRDEKTFVSKGIYKVINPSVIEISELPIGRWSEDYKEFLESLIPERGEKEDKKKKKKGPVVLDYQNHCTDTEVKFVITLKPGYLNASKWSEGEIDTVEKDFNLTSTKYTSVSNMHLYNETGTITKYSHINDILEEYYELRLKLYEKRRIHQIKELEEELKIISAKCAFIQSILDEKISIFRKPKLAVNEILKKNKFPGCSNNKSIPCDSLPNFDKITNEYDYLIKLPIYTLTEEEIEKLKENKDNLEKDFKELSNKTNKDMWNEELFFLKKMYKKLY
tara:strand:- start:7670 stop:11065 length:3396 start_codon:yes stop_codon:yes gene_type:complete